MKTQSTIVSKEAAYNSPIFQAICKVLSIDNDNDKELLLSVINSAPGNVDSRKLPEMYQQAKIKQRK